MTRPLADVSILSVNGLKKHLLPTLLEILQHTSFKDCVVNRARYFAHLNILWGFILLAFTTASVAAGIYLLGKQTPWPLYHPVKVIGNIGGLILITGALIALWRRLAYGSDSGKTTYSDWLFLLTVLLTGISGLLTEVFRLINIPRLAYSTYFIHLVLVWILFVSLPFSKFAHLLYRTTAMIYTRIQRMQESL
jgi:quinone-modifying oxidoreductase subunit QmoC